MFPKIIMFAGKAESGKGTVADIFREILEKNKMRVLTICFGDLLKFYCTQYFGWDGVKDEKGRALLQEVGTNLVRLKKKSFWADRVFDFIALFEDDYDVVLIPDARYPNEINTMIQHFASGGVYTIWVEREGYENNLTEGQRNHSSENSLNEHDCDYKIINNNINQLREICETLVDGIFWNK